MKIISTKIHGVLDYLVGTFLILSPWIFGLNPTEPEGVIFIVLGIMAFIYSIITNYELGLIRIIPVKLHLMLDILSGIVLAASPWLFEFSGKVYIPHLVLGLFEIVAGLITQTKAWPKVR